MENKQIKELILQSLEHEKGGVKVYATALKCAQNDDLKKEWKGYHEQTQNHVRVLTSVCNSLELDADEETPGRKIVCEMGMSLVKAMEDALKAGEPAAAELVACECVVIAETKDHLDWQLLGEVAKTMTGAGQKALMEAVDEVEDEEDEHLYHTKGWCRELWLESLGLDSELPPPEEKNDVKTAIGQARTEQARKM
jgi:rubrerythrin